jgi:sigma-E factor negative regulatory protein RseB
MQSAALGANFQGTLVFSVDGAGSSSRVWHFVVGDQTYERIEALDGRMQQIVRHNDVVHTLWPQRRLAMVERRDSFLAAWSTTPQIVEPRALDQYELQREGQGRIAGREAVVLLLQPQDDLRYAQRLWTDQATGLMLRADMLGSVQPGSPRPVLESTAFSDIAIGVKPQPEAVMTVVRSLEAYRLLPGMPERTTLDAEGWSLLRTVAGFRLTGCVRRKVEAGADGEPVVQAVFSDGATHVSVFVEPQRPQQSRAEGQSRQGAMATLTVRRGEHWLTAVGDVPPGTLKLFVDAMERRRP